MNAQIGKGWNRAAGVFVYSIVTLLSSFTSARGDTVSTWNVLAGYMAASSERSPARAARDLAIVRAAMFETMNFVEGKYVPRFLVKPPASLGASSEVEAIGAAHYVLTQLYPAQKAMLDVALESSLFAFPDSDASRARVWGKHLGGNVYALWPSDRPANGAKALPGAGMAWNSDVTRFVEAKALEPIERARILALVSLAVSGVYSAADSAKAPYGSTAPCISCAVGSAIRVILETEFGSASLAEVGVVNEGMPGESYWMRVRNDAGKAERFRDGLDSARAGEEMGRKIGLQALTYYRPVK